MTPDVIGKWVALVLAIAGVLGLGTCGCKSQAQNADEQMQMIETRVQAAKEMGVKAHIYAVLPLYAGFTMEWNVGNRGWVWVDAEVDPNAERLPPTEEPRGMNAAAPLATQPARKDEPTTAPAPP